MKKVIATMILLISVISKAGNDQGGGGSLKEMLEAERQSQTQLTKLDIQKIVENDGRDLKVQFIQSLFRRFIADPDLEPNLKVMSDAFKNNYEQLKLDITNSKIKIGSCSSRRDLCTKNLPNSDIIIDEKTIQKAGGITFSELVGLIVHEFSHHIINDADHPEYKLALYMKNLLLRSPYVSEDPDYYSGRYLGFKYFDSRKLDFVQQAASEHLQLKPYYEDTMQIDLNTDIAMVTAPFNPWLDLKQQFFYVKDPIVLEKVKAKIKEGVSGSFHVYIESWMAKGLIMNYLNDYCWFSYAVHYNIAIPELGLELKEQSLIDSESVKARIELSECMRLKPEYPH